MRLVTYRTPYPTRARARIPTAYSPVTRLYEEMNRLFEDSFGQMRGLAGEMAGEMAEFSPSIDVDQDDDAYTVTLEIPGVKREDVSVEVREGMLVVSGTKTKAPRTSGGEGENVQSSRRFGRFSQAMTLPDDAKRDAISAEFADGVLHVSIPRDPEHGKDRTLRIEVQQSEGASDKGSDAESSGDDAENPRLEASNGTGQQDAKGGDGKDGEAPHDEAKGDEAKGEVKLEAKSNGKGGGAKAEQRG